VPDSLAPEGPRISIIARASTALGVSAIASLVAALPAALRIAPFAQESGARVWIALAAAALVPMIVAVALARAAREGLRAFAGVGALARAVGFVAWVALTFITLAVLGGALRATTHNAPLAGVTFAVFALAAVVILALAAKRVVAVVRNWNSWSQRIAFATALFLFAAALLAVSVRAPHAGALTVDLLAFAIAACFASREDFTASRSLAFSGTFLAMIVFVIGALTFRASPLPSKLLFDHAPAYTFPTQILASR
jgi:hypothetical protein